MGMGIVIGVIAVAILVYFAYFSGKQVPVPEIKNEIPDESVINAEVKDKRIAKNPGKRNYFILHYVGFECEDSEYREFLVSKELYEALETGTRDVLIYADGQFVGFGDYGAIAGEVPAEAEDDGFTYDDYDESIDVEQDMQTAADVMSPEDREHFELFLNREKLPVKTETVEDEAPALSEYSVISLFEKTTVYPFLKQENSVRAMFARTFREAMDDLLGYDGDSRHGRSANSVVINKNEIRVSMILEENPKPLMDRVTAEFGVND